MVLTKAAIALLQYSQITDKNEAKDYLTNMLALTEKQVTNLFTRLKHRGHISISSKDVVKIKAKSLLPKEEMFALIGEVSQISNGKKIPNPDENEFSSELETAVNALSSLGESNAKYHAALVRIQQIINDVL